ncbi:MAG: phosphoribosylglycinamide formyltransferase [Piscirickettsiaceae bacterium]|nr:phosphoribosylglycinamide formyltransferase [Piscirickettsiaceae bacterium]
MTTSYTPAKLVILISGRGSNMVSILDAIMANRLNADIVAVISNRPDAAGLSAAAAQGIVTDVVDHTEFDSRDTFDRALANTIDRFKPDLVILAGFMRILTADFVAHFNGKLINIHPSLLPKFKGLNTHQRALEAKEAEHGATVHFVTAELDDGPIVLQARVPVLADDDATTLAKRVLAQEHQLYPNAIKKIIEDRAF